MPSARYAALLLILAVGVANGEEPLTAQVTWFGRFTVSTTAKIANPNSLSGEIARSDNKPENIQTTTRIPAAIGTHFGFGYVLRGKNTNSIVVRHVWRFPEGGLTNPSNGKSATYFEIERTCRIGDWCSNAWVLNHDWELKPGSWAAEVWVGQDMLLSRAFEVYKP